jgi:hypothetical protein
MPIVPYVRLSALHTRTWRTCCICAVILIVICMIVRCIFVRQLDGFEASNIQDDTLVDVIRMADYDAADYHALVTTDMRPAAIVAARVAAAAAAGSGEITAAMQAEMRSNLTSLKSALNGDTQQQAEDALVRKATLQLREMPDGKLTNPFDLARIYFSLCRASLLKLSTELTPLVVTAANQTSGGFIHAPCGTGEATSTDIYRRTCTTHSAVACGCQVKQTQPAVVDGGRRLSVARLGEQRYSSSLEAYAYVITIFGQAASASQKFQVTPLVKLVRDTLDQLSTEANATLSSVQTDGRAFSVAYLKEVPEHDGVVSVTSNAKHLATEVAAAGLQRTVVEQYIVGETTGVGSLGSPGTAVDVGECTKSINAPLRGRIWLSALLRSLCSRLVPLLISNGSPTEVPPGVADTQTYEWSGEDTPALTTDIRTVQAYNDANFIAVHWYNVKAVLQSGLRAIGFSLVDAQSFIQDLDTIARGNADELAALQSTTPAAIARRIVVSESVYQTLPSPMHFEISMRLGSSERATKAYQVQLPWNVALFGAVAAVSKEGFRVSVTPVQMGSGVGGSELYATACMIELTRLRAYGSGSGSACAGDGAPGWHTPVTVHLNRGISQKSIANVDPLLGDIIYVTPLPPPFYGNCDRSKELQPLQCRQTSRSVPPSLRMYRDLMLLIDKPPVDTKGQPSFMTSYAQYPLFVHRMAMYVKQLIIQVDDFGTQPFRSYWLTDGKAPNGQDAWVDRVTSDVRRLYKLLRGLGNLCSRYYLVAVDSIHTGEHASKSSSSGTKIETGQPSLFSTYYYAPVTDGQKRLRVIRSFATYSLTFRRKDDGVAVATEPAGVDFRSKQTLGLVTPEADIETEKVHLKALFGPGQFGSGGQ